MGRLGVSQTRLEQSVGAARIRLAGGECNATGRTGLSKTGAVSKYTDVQYLPTRGPFQEGRAGMLGLGCYSVA